MNNINSLISPFKFFGNMKMLAMFQAIILIVIWIMVPSTILPSPLEIMNEWNNLALHDGMLVELGKSIVTIWKAIIYSAIISFGIAYLATASIFKPIAAWLTALRFLGFAGITFLFTLWTSNGSELKIALLTFGMSVFLLTNALSMIQNISQDQIDYARTLQLSGWRITYELAFRDRLDEALDLIRQNAAMGWTLLSMVEGLVRSEGGIGDLLLNQNKHLHLSAVFAIQITILVYGIFQDSVLQMIRRIICPYVKFNGSKS
jgi:ABC-type nitrate/sulfonate/bicarbonate transport system permease component